MKVIKTCRSCKAASKGRRNKAFVATNRRLRRKGKNAFLMKEWMEEKLITVNLQSTGFVG